MDDFNEVEFEQSEWYKERGEEMDSKYQQIIIRLSDGRKLVAIVPEFCKEGDELYLHPQFEVTAPKKLPNGYSWGKLTDTTDGTRKEAKR